MNPRFEKILGQYSSSAKNDRKLYDAGQLNAAAKLERAERLQQNARQQALGENRAPGTLYEEVAVEQFFASHKRIYEIQNKKQKVMDWLHEQLSRLDELETQIGWVDCRTDKEQKEAKPIRSIKLQGEAFYCVEEKRAVDIGTILTDGEWGIRYRFQPKPDLRLTIKKYLVAEAKRKIQVLLDDQILEEELTRAALRDDTKGASAFEELSKRLKTESLSGGEIAEKMVRGFLSKIALTAGLDFEVTRADAYDDVRGKVDFIIRRKDYRRGVRVAAEHAVKTTGIQFTLDDYNRTIINKEYQIEKVRKMRTMEHVVDDVVLVSIPLAHIADLYRDWMGKNRPCGGPDMLWDATTKQQVFNKVLQGVYSDGEIAEQWQKYQDSLGEGSKLEDMRQAA